MTALLVSLFLLLFPALVQDLPPAFPREGATQIFDNERVTVWDAIWAKGKPTAMQRYKYDTLGIELADSTVRVTPPNGTPQVQTENIGLLNYEGKGLARMEEGTSDTQRHAIMIELKDVTVPPLENTSGFPNAMPRDGAKKIMEDARVIVWDYSWTSGKPTPMHFHDKDVVVTYLNNGDLKSNTPDGVSVINSYVFGQVKFNARNRTHSEELVKGAQRAIIVELK